MNKVYADKNNIAKAISRDLSLLKRDIDDKVMKEATEAIIDIPLNISVLNSILDSMPEEQMISNRDTVVSRLYSSNILAAARILENDGTLEKFTESVKNRFARGGALDG